MSQDSLKPTAIHSEYKIDAHPNDDYILSDHGISRVMTSDTHIQLGNMTFHRDDFRRAFEGSLNTGYSPAPSRKFANPVPIGVASFSLSLFVLSLVNAGARGVTNAKGAVGLCLFYAGFIELIAGIWCIVIENTWAATLLSSFAGFWIANGLFLVDAWGMVSSYDKKDFASMNGFFLLGWLIFSTMMWTFTFKSTWVLFTMMFMVVLTVALLCGAAFAGYYAASASAALTKAGGIVGLITSFIGWYVTYEGIATKENAYFLPPVLLMPSAVIGPPAKASNAGDEQV